MMLLFLPAVVPCLSEMTAVMSCWKVNSFDDVPCRKEIQDFVACAEKAVSCVELKMAGELNLAFSSYKCCINIGNIYNTHTCTWH